MKPDASRLKRSATGTKLKGQLSDYADERDLRERHRALNRLSRDMIQERNVVTTDF